MRDFHKLLVALTGCACAFSVGCGGGSSKTAKSPVVITTTGQNVASITVNSGPAGNYVNGAFTSVTVCVPGSSTCQTVDGVLVDTGSTGLRILSSALTVALPQQNTSSGNPVVECLPFLASYTWGPVQTADVKISGESASAVPIQVLSDTDFPLPASSVCKTSGMQSADNLQSLGANGILGVGEFAQDCGNAAPCVQTGSAGLYYQCPTSGCVLTGEPVAQQVQNPVALFATDNNGVIIELPAAPGPEPSLTGSLVFGIGTEANNGLNGATVYTADANGNFTTTYNGTPYARSFIDSGSNGYFFPDTNPTKLPTCADANFFYCPTSTQNLSAANAGANGASGTVNFSIANADTLFSNASDFVYGDLGGPSGSSPFYFDWGLPFFYGRNVYTAIEGMNAPGGAPPYWAY